MGLKLPPKTACLLDKIGGGGGGGVERGVGVGNGGQKKKSTSTVTLSSHSGWVAQCVNRSVILCERFPRSTLSRVKGEWAGFSVFLSLYIYTFFYFLFEPKSGHGILVHAPISVRAVCRRRRDRQ